MKRFKEKLNYGLSLETKLWNTMSYEATDKRCKSILIVEDEKDIRDTLQQVLEIEGYHVVTAANGREGLERLTKLPQPCLILLDLMMPVMNGWEFLKAHRENDIFATIPVVIVSAVGEAGQPTMASGFIKKPVNLDALLKFVHYYCD